MRYFFENMASFSPILNQDLQQGKLMAAVNSQKLDPKTAISNVRNRLKFGKISRKDLYIFVSENIKQWTSRILS